MMFKLTINKLRAFSLFSGVYLLLLSAWASVRYDVPVTTDEMLSAIGMGVAVLLLHASVSYAKFGVRRTLDQWQAWRDPASRPRTFVTSSPLDCPEDTLDTIESTLTEYDRYDEIRREEFSDGPGLTVVYSTYHTLFVRMLKTGELAVSSDSQRVDDLVDAISDIPSSSLKRTSVNPFTRPEPVRGAPRAVLTLCLVVLVVLGTGSVAGAAYPSNAYNPGEKTVLVSFDLRSDVDPTMTTSEIQLAKSAFLVNVLDEKSVEIAIVNSTDGRARHARYALTISEDTTQLLRSVNDSSSPDRRKRIERIEMDLDEGEREVAATLTKAIRASEGDEAPALLPVRNEFRRRANASASDPGSVERHRAASDEAFTVVGST